MRLVALAFLIPALVLAQIQQLPGQYSALFVLLRTDPPCTTGTETIRHVGYLIFPGFEALDLVGPHNPLNMLSSSYSLNLSIIALTLDPVPAKINHTGMVPKPGVFSNYTPLYITPTHTVANPPADLGELVRPHMVRVLMSVVDLILIPGGMGTRIEENMAPLAAYVREIYPSLK